MRTASGENIGSRVRIGTASLRRVVRRCCRAIKEGRPELAGPSAGDGRLCHESDSSQRGISTEDRISIARFLNPATEPACTAVLSSWNAHDSGAELRRLPSLDLVTLSDNPPSVVLGEIADEGGLSTKVALWGC